MTLALVSYTPANNTLLYDPADHVEWRFSNDDPGVTWVLETGSSGTTIESGISSPAADPVVSNVVGSGWDVTQTIDVGTGDLIVRARPTGGWAALANYGVAGEPASLGALQWIEVWAAAGTPGSRSSWIGLQVIVGPVFTTGLGGDGKLAAASDLSPLQIATGAIATVDAAREVMASENYVAAFRGATVHVSMGVSTLGATDRPPVDLYFPSSFDGFYTEVAVTRIWIDADVQSVLVGIRCHFESAHGGRVRVTIGGATAVVITADDTDNADEQTESIAAGDIGGEGWWDVTLEMERLAGTGSTNAYIRNIRIQDEVIAAADLPDPVDD